MRLQPAVYFYKSDCVRFSPFSSWSTVPLSPTPGSERRLKSLGILRLCSMALVMVSAEWVPFTRHTRKSLTANLTLAGVGLTKL